jgi:hypothetical protein
MPFTYSIDEGYGLETPDQTDNERMFCQKLSLHRPRSAHPKPDSYKLEDLTFSAT